MKVITNNQLRPFLYSYDVPQSVLDDYDHLDESESFDGWIKYRGVYHHISDFMRISNDSPFDNHKWDGYTSDSFFSGLLLQSDDLEEYRIGLYLS